MYKDVIYRTVSRILSNALGDELSRKMDRLEFGLLDLKVLMSKNLDENDYNLETAYPFAIKSQDFKSPKGSKSDFTRCPAFVADVMKLFSRTVSYLDLGCSNGGLVYDFLLESNAAFGIDGSDFGISNKSQHWRIIPNNLSTADLTKPFQIFKSKKKLKFDVIGAWEVLEHIHEDDLNTFFQNVSEHLNDEGLFMASVAQFPDFDLETGEVWHVTLKSHDWWSSKFAEFGFSETKIPEYFHFPRGDGNPTVYDWDVKKNSTSGFHVFLKKHS